MFHRVYNSAHNLQILGTIVVLHAVSMVDLFTLAERAAQLLLSYQSMLVDIPSYVSQRMIWTPYEYIAV